MDEEDKLRDKKEGKILEEPECFPLVSKENARLRYIWTEHRWYRSVVLTILIAAIATAVYFGSGDHGEGMRDQIDLCSEGLLDCPNSTIWVDGDEANWAWPTGLLTQGLPGVPQDPLAPPSGPRPPSPDSLKCPENPPGTL